MTRSALRRTRRGPLAGAVLVGVGIGILSMGVLSSCEGSPTAAPESALEVPRIADLSRIDPAVAAVVRRKVAAAESDLDNGTAFGELGRIYHAHQYFELARRCYEIAHRLEPREQDWPYYLGLFAAERGRNEEALRYLTIAARQDTGYAPVHYHLGELHLRLGALESAEESFRTYLDAELEPSWGHIGLAKIELRRQHPDVAVAELEKALQADPTNREGLYLQGQLYRELGRETEAKSLLARLDSAPTSEGPTDRVLESALRLRRDLQTTIRAANEALESGNTERAEALYRSILAQDDEHFDALQNLGVVLGRTGRFEEAKEVLQQAVELRPGSREAHHSLAMAHASLQELEAAMAELRRALEIDPEHEPSRRMLEDLELYTAQSRP